MLRLIKWLKKQAMAWFACGSLVFYYPLLNAEVQLPSLRSTPILNPNDWIVGNTVMRYIYSKEAIIWDPLLQGFLESLVSSLVPYTGVLLPQTHIITIDEPTLNAFAMPGGVIGIHIGTFRFSDSVDELAFVISHEIAHLTQGHHQRLYQDNKSLALGSLVFLGALAVGIVPALLGALGATQQNKLTFNRSLEFEADRFGLSVLAKAGYDPQGAVLLNNKMVQLFGDKGAKTIQSYLQTHPLTQDRVRDLRARVGHIQSESMTLSPATQARIEQTRFSFDLLKVRDRVQRMSKAALRATKKQLKTTFDLLDQKSFNQAEQKKLYQLSLVLFYLDQAEKSLPLIEYLNKKSPMHEAFSLLYAEHWLALENYKKAHQVVESYLMLHPDSLSHGFLKYSLYKERGQVAKTGLEINRLVELDPDNPVLWQKLNAHYRQQEDLFYFFWSGAYLAQLVGNLPESLHQKTLAEKAMEANKKSKKDIRDQLKKLKTLKKEINTYYLVPKDKKEKSESSKAEEIKKDQDDLKEK